MKICDKCAKQFVCDAENTEPCPFFADIADRHIPTTETSHTWCDIENEE